MHINKLKDMNRFIRLPTARQNNSSNFSVLRALVQKREHVLREAEQTNFNQFCSKLFRVHLFDQLSRKHREFSVNKLRKIALFDTDPLRSILGYFHTECRRGFDDELLAQVVSTLGKSYAILVQDRHAKRQQEAIYRKITKTDDKFDPLENGTHQAEKNRYYFEGEPLDKEKLLENPTFNSLLNQLLNSANHKIWKTEATEGLKSDIDQWFAESKQKDVAELFKQLNDRMESSHDRVTIYADAIISLRKQYLQMIRAQEKERAILGDPNLNISLLELEESMLALGLISFEEVKEPWLLENEDYNVQESTKILKKLINQITPGFSEFVEKTMAINSNPNEEIGSNYAEETRDAGLVLREINRMCNLPLKEYNNYGIAKNKWFEQVVNSNSLHDATDFNLPCDRIFRTRYLQTVQFIHNSLHDFNRYYDKLGFQHRVHYLEALTRLGFHQEALDILKRSNIKGVSTFDLSTLLSFVSLLNNLFGSFDSGSLVPEITQALASYLKTGSFSEASLQKSEGHAHIVSLTELCAAINFLYNSKATDSDAYRQLIEELSSRVATISNPQLWADYALAADILTETDPKFWSYLNFDSNIFDPLHYPNPLLKKLHSSIKKYSSCFSNLPESLISLGFSDLKSQKSTVLYVAPAQLSSINGDFINGNLRAHLTRLGNKINAVITPLNVNSALNLDAASHSIDLKDRSALQEVLQAPILSREQTPVYHFCKETLEYLLHNLGASWRAESAAKLISSTIKTILQLNRKQRMTISYNLAVANRYRVVYALTLLEKQLFLLPGDISPLRARLASLLNTLKQEKVSFKESELPGFAGLRQSIDSYPPKQVDVNEQWAYEVVDFEVTNDIERYNEYASWSHEIENSLGKFNCSSIPINEQTSSFVKAYLSPKYRNASHITIVPSLLPRKPRVSPYPVKWESIYKQAPREELEKALELDKIVKHPVELTEHTQQLIRLQNFKYELKQKSIPEIAQLLLRFEFIENLIDEHLGNSAAENEKPRLLKRNPSDYFGYLEEKPKSYVSASPYLSYIGGKMKKKCQLQHLLQARKDGKARARVLVAENKINHAEYKRISSILDENVIRELESYRDTQVGAPLALLENTNSEFFQTEIDNEQFANFLKTINFYRKSEDPDVILADGDFNRALNIKRRRSEEKLIKLRIIYKQALGQELSSKEKKYLEHWQSELIKGGYNVPENFTSKSLGSISKQDQKILEGLSYSRLDQAGNLALSDFVLELSLFFDANKVKEAEVQLQSSHLIEKYGVNPSLFDSRSVSKLTSYRLNQQEKQLFDEAEKLTSEEIDAVLKISGMAKVEGYFDRKDYAKIYHNARQEIELLNSFENRENLITEWFRLKEEEFTDRYNSHATKQYKEANLEEVWLSLFKTSYAQTTTQQLHTIVNQLCERLYILSNKKHAPVYTGALLAKVLSHPNLHIIDRNNLLGSIELFQVRPQIDSADLIMSAQSLQSTASY